MITMITMMPLVPTTEERHRAREAYYRRFTDGSGHDDDPTIEGRAQLYAMTRLYPEQAKLLGDLDLDALFGFGVVDVGTPRERHFHCLLEPESFLVYALQGKIVLREHEDRDGRLDGRWYPDYIGRTPLRG